MKHCGRQLVLVMLLVCSVANGAWADAVTDVQSKVDGALRNAKSYVITTVYPAQEYASTLVYVAPDRSRVAVAISASTTDVVTVGNTSYSSRNGTPFERAPVDDAGARLKATGHVKVGTLRPDITVAGTTFGAFDAVVPLGTAVTLTCSYEKKSYRLVRCANSDITQIYNNYDDPKNVVETPKTYIEVPKGGK